MYQKIKYDDYLNIKDDCILIDVQEKEEYLKKHIEGSLNIPLNNIVSVLNVIKDKNKKVVLYCSNGKRSYIAAISLINLGYKHVYDLIKK